LAYWRSSDSRVRERLACHRIHKRTADLKLSRWD
jgi:hypothetical protein